MEIVRRATSDSWPQVNWRRTLQPTTSRGTCRLPRLARQQVYEGIDGMAASLEWVGCVGDWVGTKVLLDAGDKGSSLAPARQVEGEPSAKSDVTSPGAGPS